MLYFTTIHNKIWFIIKKNWKTIYDSNLDSTHDFTNGVKVLHWSSSVKKSFKKLFVDDINSLTPSFFPVISISNLNNTGQGPPFVFSYNLNQYEIVPA